ncbi:unnamed protein product, partial [Rotaria sp. Silwood2]
MYTWLHLFITVLTACAEQQGSLSANSGGIFHAEVSTKNIGRIKYRDGEVMISQNQQKPSDFFFTPFPYIQSEETKCYENVFNDRIELGLSVELYTMHLVEAVKDYLHKRQPVICGNSTLHSLCDVSLIPMNSIRIVQKASNTINNRQKYVLDESWHSATLLLQSMEFIVYPTSMNACEQLRMALTERCRLPNFEVHYSLYGQQTIQKQLEVTTEHVTHTNMYNQIRAQFPSSDRVLLTGGDFKQLLNESMSRITATLRIQEGFEDLQDPIAVDKLLEQQLSTQHVELQMTNDRLWNELYWTPEVTRPDYLAKVLNTIVRKDDGNSENFIYNSQAAKDAMLSDSTEHRIFQNDVTRHNISGFDVSRYNINQANLRQHDINGLNTLNENDNRVHLKHHDKQRLQQFDKKFNANSQSDSSFNSERTSSGGGGGVKFFGIQLGASGRKETHIQQGSSHDQTNMNENQHGQLTDPDMLKVTNMDNHNLNQFGSAQNHLNETQTHKEEF